MPHASSGPQRHFSSKPGFHSNSTQTHARFYTESEEKLFDGCGGKGEWKYSKTLVRQSVGHKDEQLSIGMIDLCGSACAIV